MCSLGFSSLTFSYCPHYQSKSVGYSTFALVCSKFQALYFQAFTSTSFSDEAKERLERESLKEPLEDGRQSPPSTSKRKKESRIMIIGAGSIILLDFLNGPDCEDPR